MKVFSRNLFERQKFKADITQVMVKFTDLYCAHGLTLDEIAECLEEILGEILVEKKEAEDLPPKYPNLVLRGKLHAPDLGVKV